MKIVISSQVLSLALFFFALSLSHTHLPLLVDVFTCSANLLFFPFFLLFCHNSSESGLGLVSRRLLGLGLITPSVSCHKASATYYATLARDAYNHCNKTDNIPSCPPPHPKLWKDRFGPSHFPCEWQRDTALYYDTFFTEALQAPGGQLRKRREWNCGYRFKQRWNEEWMLCKKGVQL